MSVAQRAAESSIAGPSLKGNWVSGNRGLLLAVAALVIITLLPTPDGLPVAGHRMLAILAFAVVVWMTEALDYAVSAVVIAALIAFLIGTAPNPANPKVLMGTSSALGLAFSGFANTALALVAAALFLAAAMMTTGLGSAHRPRHPRPRRHRDAPRDHGLDPGRVRPGVHGAVDDGAGIVHRADHARHHCRVRR